MKTVKINFCGFWGSFKKEDNLFYKILSRHFNVEISENPDFVICSNRGEPLEYMKYDCVRIMFMGENMSPDFTVFDYVILLGQPQPCSKIIIHQMWLSAAYLGG